MGHPNTEHVVMGMGLRLIDDYGTHREVSAVLYTEAEPLGLGRVVRGDRGRRWPAVRNAGVHR
jgi:hypothetical protein